MPTADEKRFKSEFRIWNKRQKDLRGLLKDHDRYEEAINLLLIHHAVLHSRKMANSESWSFEDAVLNGLTEEKIRRIPKSEEHSVAWLFWHMARIEDVAMNTLVAGRPQVFVQEGWRKKLHAAVQHTGNAMEQDDVARFSATVDVSALRGYRLAVGRRTREIIQGLGPEALNKRVDPIRIQQVLDQGDVLEAASGITDYWSKRTIEGLLMMPATRHNMVHLNEAFRVASKK